VLALEDSDEDAMKRLHLQCELAIEIDRSEAIILGCAGMVSLQQELQDYYGSRASAYAEPVEKIFKTNL